MKKKKILKVTGIFLLVFVGVLAAAPFIFENKIKNIVKESVNNNIDAKFDFSDVSLSFFKSFPEATVIIDDASIINTKEPFIGDTLFYARKASLSMSVKELFKGNNEPIGVKEFNIDDATVNVLVDKNGKANYDIAKPDENDTASDGEESSGLSLVLQSYAINNSKIVYRDESSKMLLSLKELNHSGSGDLSAEKSELDTETSALVSFEMDSTGYLKDNTIKLSALIGIDLKDNKYSFLKNEALINQLPLVFDGFVKVNENNQEVDVTFKTPSSDFKNFLAVIPEAYSKNIEHVKTTGNFEVNGFFKGIVDDKHIPAFKIDVASADASFKYPDLPKTVNDIQLQTTLANETGITNDTYVLIDRLSFRIDQDVFNAKAQIRNIIDNPLVKAEVKGRLNLANLSKAYPVSLETPLKGILDADIRTEFDMNSIEKEQYLNTKNEGELSLSGFEYASAEMKNPVAINKADVTFNPKTVGLNEFDAKTGNTDIKASGTIDNLLGFMFNDENMKGNFVLFSNNFELNDFMVDEAGDNEEGEKQAENAPIEEQIKIPSFLDATVQANANTVVYDNLKLKNVKGTLRIKDETASLVDVSSDLFGGKLALSGDVSTKTETPVFNMNLNMNAFDIAESFNGLELFKALTPIAGALQGKLNSTLSLKGDLNSDFTPSLASISGNALAEILGSTLNPEKSKALNLLGNNLNFIDLKKIDLNKLKTSLSFENGKVKVKPFQLKYQDIVIDVAGNHGFDKTMSYNATFQVPAKYLGNDVKNALAKLNTEKDAENITVPVTASIGGTFTQPKLNTDLKQAVTNLTQQLVQQQKDKLVNQGKDQLKDALGNLLGNNKKDSTQNTTAADSTKKASKDNIKNAAESAIKNLFGKKKKDTTGGN